MTLHWLRHAFAIPHPDEFRATPAQVELVQQLCQATVDRELQAPALIFLESVRPLHRLSAQGLHFFAPILSLIGKADSITELARMLEHPGAIEFFAATLERTVSRPATSPPDLVSCPDCPDRGGKPESGGP